MLDVQETGCCAVDEIVHLSDHKTPKDAMKTFCRYVLDRGSDLDLEYLQMDLQNLEEEFERGEIERREYELESGYIKNDIEHLKEGNSIPGLITFTGVVAHTDKSKSLKGFKYAPEFAKYIKKAKLGDVVESKPGVNRVNHPTHVVKLWCWTPDTEALVRWYKRNG